MTRATRVLLAVVIFVGLIEAALVVGYMVLGPRLLDAMLHWRPGITGPG